MTSETSGAAADDHSLARSLEKETVSRVAALLRAKEQRVVMAESCTAGWVSAMLSAVPGISAYLCGSLVTYREASKQAWLGVEERVLHDHTAVSSLVTRQMAEGALLRTPEATWALAVTGHVGPDAPPQLDGVCFIAIARRKSQSAPQVDERRLELASHDRTDRQKEAARELLSRFADLLAAQPTRENTSATGSE